MRWEIERKSGFYFNHILLPSPILISFQHTFGIFYIKHPTSNRSCLSQGVEMSPGKWNRKMKLFFINIFIDLQLHHVSTINQRTTSGFFKFEWFFGLWTNSIRSVLFRFWRKKNLFYWWKYGWEKSYIGWWKVGLFCNFVKGSVPVFGLLFCYKNKNKENV